MTDVLDPAQRRFLEDHQWAVLATVSAGGAPQQSMVGYVTDAEGRIVISTKAHTAKWRNALGRPQVSLTVVDGRAHLAIAGTAEAIDADPERAELSADVFASPGRHRPPRSRFACRHTRRTATDRHPHRAGQGPFPRVSRAHRHFIGGTRCHSTTRPTWRSPCSSWAEGARG